MIVGILPNASSAEILLNNLAEADFSLEEVSVIMRDLEQRKAIAPDRGPLKGATVSNVADRLAQAGLSEQDARLCRNAVAQGKVLIAMTVPPEAQKAAKEMLQDHAAEFIKE
jgi:hypothetical protein